MHRSIGKHSGESVESVLSARPRHGHAQSVNLAVLINASAHRSIGRYGRSKHRKTVTSLKPVADAPLQLLTLTRPLIPRILLTTTLNADLICTKSAPFATANKHTAVPVSSCVINADNGRWAGRLMQ